MFATSSTTARRKAVPAAIAAAAGLAAFGIVAPSASATSVPPSSEGSTVVVDPGDLSQPVDLHAQPAVGDAATNTSVDTVTGTLTLTGANAQSAEVDVITTVVQSGEVTAADESGMTMRRRVESYDVADNSPDGTGNSFASDEELAPLVGIELDYQFDATNVLQTVVPMPGVELTTEQQAAVAVVLEDGSDNAALPTEPIGVGAQWTAVLPGGAGPAGALSATYTLSSFTDGEYTIDVLVEGTGDTFPLSELPEGFDEVTGTFTGTGQLVGSVDQPLVRSTELALDMDFVFSGEAGEMAMDLTMTQEASTVAG